MSGYDYDAGFADDGAENSKRLNDFPSSQIEDKMYTGSLPSDFRWQDFHISFLIAAVTNYHKFSGLKQHIFIP